MKEILKFIRNTLLIIFAIFIIVGICFGIKNYNKTWTIEDKHFKSIYKDYDDCMNNNLGTGTTDICKDKKKVKYKNGGVENE